MDADIIVPESRFRKTDSRGGQENQEGVLMQENWVDCIEGPKEEREACLDKAGIIETKERGSSSSPSRPATTADSSPPSPPATDDADSKATAAAAASASEVAEKSAAAKAAATAANPPPAGQESSDKAKAAEAEVKVTAQKAAAGLEVAQKSKDEKEKALADLEAVSSQQDKAKDDIESRYKVKLAKINDKLKADKTSIRSEKKGAIDGAKAVARAQGAHVGDIQG